MGWVEAAAIFAQGRSAFYLDVDSHAYSLLDPSSSAIADSLGYARFPAGPAGARSTNIVPLSAGINAFSKKQDAAWDFIKWVTNEENSKRLLSESTVSVARTSAWEDDAATSGYPAELVDIVRTLGDGVTN